MGAGGNGVDLLNLVEAHEDFKKEAIKQLHELRDDNAILIAKSKIMRESIEPFSKLVHDKQTGTDEGGVKSAFASTAFKNSSRRIAGHLARKVKELSIECSDYASKFDALQIAIDSMEPFSSETRREMKNMQWELDLLEGACKQRNAEIQHLLSQNKILKTENEKVQEKFLSLNIELDGVKKANSFSGYFPHEPFEQIRKAFYQDEEIINNKAQEMSLKDSLITKYEEYCRKAQVYINEIEAYKLQENNLLQDKEQISSMKEQNDALMRTVEQLKEENVQLKKSLSTFISQVEQVERSNATYLDQFARIKTTEMSDLNSSILNNEMVTECSKDPLPTGNVGSGDASESVVSNVKGQAIGREYSNQKEYIMNDKPET